MKILITGSNGFVGKNLIAELNNRGYTDLFKFDINTSNKLLDIYTKECDFIFHLAGVNRPKAEKEYLEGNVGFTAQLIDLLEKHHNVSPILLSSSLQAKLDNPYGRSKKAAEDLLFKHSKDTSTKVYVYRLPNLFGKWSRPNYNSVVATFCYNIARDLEIKINNANTDISLCYIDDALEEFSKVLEGKPTKLQDNYCIIRVVYSIKLGELAEKIKGFKRNRKDLNIPNMKDELTKKLYSTYLSYLPIENFSYPLKMNVDNRGSFTEFIRTPESGQVSINISKPGIIKGNHWHHSKNEKFLVVSGKALIKFRKINCDKIIEYQVGGEKLQVVDIPAGYTHSITNIGNTDLVTVMWVNELYNPEKPDTYYLEV